MHENDDVRGEAVEQAVRTEHRRLEELFAELAQALEEPADPESARDAFAALREEFETHIDQEDRLYYATIGALRPSLKPELEGFAEEHVEFRKELATLARLLERDDLAAAQGGFQALKSRFGRHERAEEQMLARAEAERIG